MYAIVDVETTGLGGDANRITEIAIAIHDGKKVVDEFHSLVNPEVPISPYVTGLTGIDNDMVRDAPVFAAIAETVLEYTEDKIFVAHNVGFDYNVIRREFQRAGKDFRRKKLCTVRLSRQIFPGLKSYSLGQLCSSLNIPVYDRHRAKGDTDATAILFGKLLENDTKGIFGRQLHPRSGEMTLPPLLPGHVVNKLPESPGVYYFLDEKGQIIYVGKAINIKKRVLGHFYDKTAREITMARETADIHCEETGNELLALIRESTKIKQHFPKFNTAQKKPSKGYGITAYTDRKGILHLGYNQLRLVTDPIGVFYSVTECIAFLEQYCAQYDLCPRFTHLQHNVSQCSHYKLNNCRGICRGKEQPETYNLRVRQAIEDILSLRENFFILEKGRAPDEKALIEVRDGNYAGYGFITAEESVTRYDAFRNFIIPQKYNRDIQQIINTYIARNSKNNVIYAGDDPGTDG